jgi:sialate O-acetylesterase
MIMRIKSFWGLCVVFIGLWLGQHAAAWAAGNEPRPLLHPLFCDHMVLQREAKAPVWGWASPGTKVTVTFAGQSKSAVAKADGKWMVHLNPMKASKESRSLTVTSANGGATATVRDVLVGDVWLCSGQSNMEMGIGACDVPDEIAKANFPEIRLLTIPKRIETKPVELAACAWTSCTPQSSTQDGWGGFSAVAYFFGRKLHQELGIPIGLIHSSWGGTIAEAWTSAEALRPLADFNARLDQVATASQGKRPDFNAEFDQWALQNDPGSAQNWHKPQLDASAWKTVAMPQAVEKAGLAEFDGIVWLRHEFEVPAAWAGQNLTLSLGPIDDIDTTWINGRRVGQMNRYNQDRVYAVPAQVLQPGKNVICVRVLDTGGDGGLTGKPEQMWIKPASESQAAPVSLAGEWKMKDAAPLAKLSAPPTAPDANNPNVVTVLYNGMIAPLQPFAIKGAIWYQGESNADRADQYRRLLPALISDWRKGFQAGNFPFYIVQLAAFQQTYPQPRQHAWAELREAQALTAKNFKRCGLAVAIDIGDANDIHPKNKAEVGRRLALCALAKDYGKKVEFSGPWYKSLKTDGNTIQLAFDHAGGGLVAKGAKLEGFAIAGADQKFVWANAAIQGNRVQVSSPAVPKPVAVRYAWDINPVCNLYNREGLPAVPFRTDDWPLTTRDRK